MESLVNKDLYIHCYKHDGKPHRTWQKCHVLEETDRHFIVINDHALVTEADGRRWYTREPAIWYFPKDSWYNVICMIRKTGVYYYCNIASPTLYDGEALKYIDYDLDLKVFPDYHYKVLDEGEYALHKRQYHYTQELDEIFQIQLDILIKMASDQDGPFRPGFAEKWYGIYQKQVGEGEIQ
ncbi:MAG: DUF402 domain-containing protein [Erysipelotrichaceae bacterium]|nr:DUF402 domain-containing protein [Erysipelotrichaceae bacterium]